MVIDNLSEITADRATLAQFVKLDPLIEIEIHGRADRHRIIIVFQQNKFRVKPRHPNAVDAEFSLERGIVFRLARRETPVNYPAHRLDVSVVEHVERLFDFSSCGSPCSDIDPARPNFLSYMPQYVDHREITLGQAKDFAALCYRTDASGGALAPHSVPNFPRNVFALD